MEMEPLSPLPSPLQSPTAKPRLHLTIPSWTITLPPSSDSPPPEYSQGGFSAYSQNTLSAISSASTYFSPSAFSTRSNLLYTISQLPDHVLSPSHWKQHSNQITPMALFYLVPETGVTVQVTGYANGQFVVRLLAKQTNEVRGKEGEGEREPVVAISVSGGIDYEGESMDVPAWKVRETLIERIIWNRNLD